MDTKLTSLYKNISILVLILEAPCLFLQELAESSGFGTTTVRLIIMANLAFLAFFSIKKSVFFTKVQKDIVKYFIITIIYFVFIGLTIYSGSGYTTHTQIRNLINVLLVFIIINDREFNIIRLKDSFLFVAFIFSFLSVLQFIMYNLGVINLHKYVYKTYSPGYVNYVGFGGFVDPYSRIGNIYRSQSFWREPATFAQFLQVPLFLSIYQLIRKKNMRNILYFITISSALIITFSVANFFSFLIALTIFFFLVRKDISNKYIILKRVSSYLLIIILILLIFQFYNYSNSFSGYRYSGKLLGKNTSRQFVHRFERFMFGAKVLDTSFFGDPTIRSNWHRNPSAIGMLLVQGGIPGVILCLIFAGKFYLAIIRFIKKSKYSFIYVGTISFFIAFNWYGSYYGNYFLFLIALFTVLMKYETKGKEFV